MANVTASRLTVDDGAITWDDMTIDGTLTATALSTGVGTFTGDVTVTNLIHLTDSSRVDLKFTKSGSEEHYIRKDGDYLRFRGHDDSTVLFELQNNSQSNNISFPSSNVGIGTSGPSSSLHIDVDSASGSTYGIVQNDGTANNATIAGWVIRDGSTVYGGIQRRRDGSTSPIEIGGFTSDAEIRIMREGNQIITLNQSDEIDFNNFNLTNVGDPNNHWTSAGMRVDINNAGEDPFGGYNHSGVKVIGLDTNGSGDGLFYLYSASGANTIKIHSNSSTYFNGGNVGIGIAPGGTVSNPLHVNGSVLINGSVYFGSAGTNHDVWFYGDTSGRDLLWDAGTNGGGLWFYDNVKSYWGNHGELQLYHDASNSYIQETGTGGLFIQGDTVIKIRSTSGAQGINMIPDGAVELYHNNSKMLETKSTGINVYGGDLTAVTADSVIRANYTASNNTHSATLNWQALQLGDNGWNWIISGRTVAGSGMQIVVNNSADVPAAPSSHNGTVAAVFAANGNVGIGTDPTPDYKLDVQGTGRFDSTLSIGGDIQVYGSKMGFDAAGTRTDASVSWPLYLSTDSSSHGQISAYDNLYLRAVNDHIYLQAYAGDIYIQPNGNDWDDVYIGDGGALCRVHLNGTGAYSGIDWMDNGTWKWAAWYHTADSKLYFRRNDSPDVDVMAFTDGSNDVVFAGNITAYSDKRLKTNIKTIDSALGKVNQMRGVTYDRIDYPSSGAGVLAQELEEIAPELIDNTNKYKGVSYGNLTAYLVEAIKELTGKVDSMQQQLEGLNG